MTYDIAAWKHSGYISDEAASVEFERRFEDSDSRYPDYRPAAPELVRLADMLEARFPEAPWEDLRDSLDGDFLYLTVGGADAGSEVEEYMAEIAGGLGLLVYSPMSESVTAFGATTNNQQEDTAQADAAAVRMPLVQSAANVSPPAGVALRDDELIALLEVATGFYRTLTVALLGDSEGSTGIDVLKHTVMAGKRESLDTKCAALVALARRTHGDETCLGVAMSVLRTSKSSALWDYAFLVLNVYGDDRAWGPALAKLSRLLDEPPKIGSVESAINYLKYLTLHAQDEARIRTLYNLADSPIRRRRLRRDFVNDLDRPPGVWVERWWPSLDLPFSAFAEQWPSWPREGMTTTEKNLFEPQAQASIEEDLRDIRRHVRRRR